MLSGTSLLLLARLLKRLYALYAWMSAWHLILRL
nr:MAG TPA: hypothetical protein [Caudoviricetes sp.]